MLDTSTGPDVFFFLYGSETGNSESITKRLHHDAVTTHGLTGAECMPLNQAITKKVLEDQLDEATAKSICLVIVCSTTGEGEPPQNASRFRRWLRLCKGQLHRVRYTVLALGDSNYNNFCSAGIFIDNKLGELGAVRCYPRGEADDGVGLHLVVDPWTENIWEALTATGGSEAAAVGHEKYQTADTRVDMSVALETAIIYTNASQICSALALFLHERIDELGGSATLYPLQYFHPSKTLAKPPKILLFILSTDDEQKTLCDCCAAAAAAAGLQLSPLGILSELVTTGAAAGAKHGDHALSSDAVGLQSWMADPSIRFFNSLLVATKQENVGQTTILDARLKEVLTTSCKLEYLCRQQGSGETPSIAIQDSDAMQWTCSVLDSLPGVTADADRIHLSVEWSFFSRVGAVFQETYRKDIGAMNAISSGALAPPPAGGGTRPLHRLHLRCDDTKSDAAADKDFSTIHAGGDDGRMGLQVISDLLTPVVFLYSEGCGVVKQLAHDLRAASDRHHLRSSLCELSNFRRTGFPRRATFIFIISGVFTKSMAKVLKNVHALSSQGQTLDGVKFAIIGIDQTTQSDKFNACALELETVLIGNGAMKIHCTGLADLDCPSLLPVVQAWETNLWSAVINPTSSLAYLDIASPSIQKVNSFTEPAPLFASDDALHNPEATSGIGSVTVPSLVSPVSASSPGNLPLPINFRGPGAPGPRAFSTSLNIASGGVGIHSPEDKILSHSHIVADGPESLPMPASGGPHSATALLSASFPWNSVPLSKENASRTPVAFLYASSGMSKTMAVYAMQNAETSGFPAVLQSFANYHLVDLNAYPNLILFCEAGPDGQCNGGRRLKRFLTNPSHQPDHLSHVRYGVLGLGGTPPNVMHPAFLWAKLLSRLQANRVFPVVLMPSMSQLHALGIPWTECVLSSMALLPRVFQESSQQAENGLVKASKTVEAAAAMVSPVSIASPQCSSMTRHHRSVLFLFGSSTGITESISRDLHREALERGFLSRIAALKYFDRMNFLSTATVVVVCSTTPTAPGGFPRNARKFARYLLARDQPPTLLANTQFAVLGLGNGATAERSSLPFCRAAIHIDARMAELGGHQLCPLGTVDASQSIIQPLEVWRTAFFSALEQRTAEQLQRVEEGAKAPLTMQTLRDVGEHGSVTSGSAAATAGSRAAVHRLLLAYCCPPTSVVPELTQHFLKVIQNCTSMQPTLCTLNELAKMNWRPDFKWCVFLIGSSEEGECPLNGSAFMRFVQQRTVPMDMFATLTYSVLAVGDTNATQFYLARKLDRRLEELGGCRAYARGEVVDSYSLERTVERWLNGLVNLLVSLSDGAEGRDDTEDDKDTRGELSTVMNSVNDYTRGGPSEQRGIDHRTNEAPLLTQDLLRDGEEDGEPFPTTRISEKVLEPMPAAQPFMCDQRAELCLFGRTGYSSSTTGALPCGVLHSWKRLTPLDTSELVIQLNFTVSPDTVWSPGETIALLPSNSAAEVDALLALFKIPHHELFYPLSIVGVEASAFPTAPLYDFVDVPMSCRTLLMRFVDLRVSTKNKTIFQLLKKAAPSEEALAAIQEACTALCASNAPRSLLEILQGFPEAIPPFRHVVEYLSTLQPRQYSICSSRAKDPKTLSICFKVLAKGLCTGWLTTQCLWAASLDDSPEALARVQQGVVVWAKRRTTIPFVLRRSTDFRMPRDPLVPMILIGPGTGVAPFRAFLQEREAWLAERQAAMNDATAAATACYCPYEENTDVPPLCGSIDLFFGCRRRSEDFLFQEELEAWEADGILHSLSVSFSREANDGGFWYGGCYVQDRMQECGVALMNLILQRNAYLFVCGDADGMAKEVHSTLIELAQQHLAVTEAAAVEFVEKLMKDGRYLRDVWSSTW